MKILKKNNAWVVKRTVKCLKRGWAMQRDFNPISRNVEVSRPLKKSGLKLAWAIDVTFRNWDSQIVVGNTWAAVGALVEDVIGDRCEYEEV
jgi:hypothetical protein